MIEPAALLAAFAAAAALLLAAADVSQAHPGHDNHHFDDTGGSVHAAALEALAAQGWLNGTFCAERSICPQKPLLRWEMAVWLGRALTGEDPKPMCADAWLDELLALTTTTTLPAWNDPVWTGPSWRWQAGDGDESCQARTGLSGVGAINDLSVGDWWIGHVGRFFDLGVTVGCEEHPGGKVSYCPYEQVTRAQMATFLTRALSLPEADSFGFTDTRRSHHAASIDRIAAAGITVGCSQEPLRYCPDRPVNRGQMATFLVRRFGLSLDQATTTQPAQTQRPPGWVLEQPRDYPSGDQRLPVYFCAPADAYTADEARRFVASADQAVSAFYYRESSGKLSLSLYYAGMVPLSIDGDGSPDCAELAIDANGGERQLLLLEHRPALEGIAGWARHNTGPAVVFMLSNYGIPPSRQQLHATIAHELGHSLFGWPHPDNHVLFDACADIEGSIMHSGSPDADCPGYGDDPLAHFRVICELRTRVGWACDTQPREPAAGDTPRSYRNWSAHQMSSPGGYLLAARASDASGAMLYVQCSRHSQFSEPTLDVIVWWPYQSSAAARAEVTIEFSDGGATASEPSSGASGKASYLGRWLPEGWDNSAAERTAAALTANSGSTVTFTAAGRSGGTVTSVIDTSGAHVAVRSVMNYCGLP